MLVEISERGPRDGLKTNAPGVGVPLRFPRGKITGRAMDGAGTRIDIEVDEYVYTGRKNAMGQPIFSPVGQGDRER